MTAMATGTNTSPGPVFANCPLAVAKLVAVVGLLVVLLDDAAGLPVVVEGALLLAFDDEEALLAPPLVLLPVVPLVVVLEFALGVVVEELEPLVGLLPFDELELLAEELPLLKAPFAALLAVGAPVFMVLLVAFFVVFAD